MIAAVEPDAGGFFRNRERPLPQGSEQTEAVVAKYAERGILTQVDGIGAIDKVTDRVMEATKAPLQAA